MHVADVPIKQNVYGLNRFVDIRELAANSSVAYSHRSICSFRLNARRFTTPSGAIATSYSKPAWAVHRFAVSSAALFSGVGSQEAVRSRRLNRHTVVWEKLRANCAFVF